MRRDFTYKLYKLLTMNFTDLEVWKKARLFRNEMFEFCKTLKDQILRSSRSVTANIAEGHGRFHLKENIRFCRMARGSLSEVLNHLIRAFLIVVIYPKRLRKTSASN